MAADQTLMMDTVSPSTPPRDPVAVAYFTVPPQGALTAVRTYPIYEGESIIGRDEDCDVCIPVRALSRQHATILVEEGEHFICDLDSRNYTYRRAVKLKANRYYEVTSGIELTFADIKCQYMIGQPPANQITVPLPIPVMPEAPVNPVPDPSQENTEGADGEGGEEGEDDDGGEGEGEGEGEEGQEEEGEKENKEEGEKENEGGEGEGEADAEAKSQQPDNEEQTQLHTIEDEAMEFEPFTMTRTTTALMESPPSSPLLGGGGGDDGGGGGGGGDDGGGGGEGGEGSGGVIVADTMARADEEEKHKKEEGGGGEVKEEVVKEGIKKKVGFTGLDKDGDSGSETEGEEEEEEKEEEKDATKEYECENTIPYPLDGLHDDDEEQEDAGPFDGNHGNDSTLPYDAASENENNNKQESKQQQPQEQVVKNSQSVSSEVVAGDNDQTLAYTVDTETESESDTEVRSKVKSTKPGNLATEKASPQTIQTTSNINTKTEETDFGEEKSAAPVIKSNDKEEEESEQDELPIPVTRATRSKQKTLVLEVMKAERGRGRRGRTASSRRLCSVDTDSAEDSNNRTTASSTEEKTRGRGRRGRVGRGGGRRAKFLSDESSEEQTISTDIASSEDTGTEEKEDGVRGRRRGRGGKAQLPPPSSAVSVVRRIVEGMTLKSEQSRLQQGAVTTVTTPLLKESLTIDDSTVEQVEPVSKSPPSTVELRDDQSDHGSMTSSTPSVEDGGGGGGVRGRRRGGGRRGRGKKQATTPRLQTPTSPRLQSRVSRTPTVSRMKPKVMFTGVVDKEGEETVKSLGGEMVDSVFDCTHLVTDKVRRTVKFLCCLARGCHIINDQWLGHCREEGRFLATDSYLVKDRTAERQHKFSLARSLELARHSKLLAGQKVYLSPSIKPQPTEMTDIINCSGGVVIATLPHPLEVGLLIVASPDDLSMLSEAVEEGVAVHSTELILGGVLRQELDLNIHQIAVDRRTYSSHTHSSVTMETTGRRKRKTTEEDTVAITSRPSSKRRKK